MDHGPVQRMLHRLLTIGDKLQVIEEVQCRVVNVTLVMICILALLSVVELAFSRLVGESSMRA